MVDVVGVPALYHWIISAVGLHSIVVIYILDDISDLIRFFDSSYRLRVAFVSD